MTDEKKNEKFRFCTFCRAFLAERKRGDRQAFVAKRKCREAHRRKTLRGIRDQASGERACGRCKGLMRCKSGAKKEAG